MGVHAAKTLNGNIWVRFNDYPLISIVKNDNRSTAQIANGVGENPLNGKGLPLTHNGEGEKIVYSHMKV